MKSSICVHIICLLSVFLAIKKQHLYGQDVPFSQFYFNNIYLNPALAGNSHKDYRLISNYKNQWRSISDPFKSTVISYDMPLFKSPTYNEHFGIGAAYFNDKAGSTSLQLNLFSLALSYHSQIDRYQKLSAGLMGNYGRRSIDFTTIKWESQHNGNNYDPSLPSGENGLSERYNYWDVGAGVNWEYDDPNMGIKSQAGLSVYHINQPAQSFLKDKNERLKRKWQLYGESEIEYPFFNLLPKILISKQVNSYSFNVGSLIKLKPNSQSESKYTDYSILSYVFLGTFYRYKDAIIINAIYEYKHMLTIGLSYDITISSLGANNNRKGGWEMILIYNGAFKNDKIKVKNKSIKETKPINSRKF